MNPVVFCHDFYFCTQCFNFVTESCKLFQFALQKDLGQRGFFGKSAGGQYIDVAELVLGTRKILHLDQPLFH